MAIITIEQVMQNLGDVTSEQIGKCHRITGPDQKDFYLVENERGDRDMDGCIIEYAVRYSPIWGFGCTCPSGAAGFWNVHHPSGVCKHCRWVVKAALEERGYMEELAAKEEQRRDEEENKQPAMQPPSWYDERNETSYYTGTRKSLAIGPNGLEEDDRTYARVMNAQPYPWTEEEIKSDQERYAPRPFKIIDEG